MLPIAEYDYDLPPELIAQTPATPRDHSRLLVLDRTSGALEHRRFYEIGEYLQPGDLLVANESRVLPARLYGHKPTGGRVEILLLRQLDEHHWESLVRGKSPVGSTYIFAAHDSAGAEIELVATVEEALPSGGRRLRFNQPVAPLLPDLGIMPLPPYITAPLADPERYQTVYSAAPGSVAAPTAGLHWTPELLTSIQAAGVQWATVTLHVGLDTFRPVQTENALDHAMHREWYALPASTATAITATRQRGGRVIAVGTTTVRVLETAASAQQFGAAEQSELSGASGWTDIFLYPPYRFRAIDGLITNFHLPRSTLLLLVSALAGREKLLSAYAAAIQERYRFFSFGDAMLIC